MKCIYVISDSDSLSGAHRHKQTIQALICVSSADIVYFHNSKAEQEVTLSSPSQCLIVSLEVGIR